MPKSVTVQFDDGTSHIYDNVPDEVSEDEVKARASEDSGKTIAQINPLSEQEKATKHFNEQTPIESAMGGLGAAANLIGQGLTSPVGNLAEAAIGGKYAIDKIAGAMRGPNPPTAPIAPAVAQAQQATGTYGKPNLTLQQGGIAPNAGQQAFNQMGQQLTKTPLPSPSMMQQGMNYAKQMQQIAASKVMPALNAASKDIIPAQIAMGVGYTSPEEIATLKAAEARKRAQGWKPLNER
jgi:hypothetical protein